MADAEFNDVFLHTPEEQLALLQELRPRMSTVEFVFHDGDAGSPPSVTSVGCSCG